MSEQLHNWCLELLTNATGDNPPNGHTAKEEEYKWCGFASHGYRNTDVVNSMIAFFYEHPEIPTDRSPWWASGTNKMAVKEYWEWAKEHVDKDDDLYDVEMKARDVIPYIWRYRDDPKNFLIQCDYLPYEVVVTF